MTYLTRATAAAGVLLAWAGLLAAGPAQAAPRDLPPSNWVFLSVTRGDPHTGAVRGTLLQCDPPVEDARAASACSQLAAVGGDISRMPQNKNVLCPMIYAPVTAQARGLWNGRPVDYRETFPSACVMNARTGSVFALDG
ncbi:SSI family serine proteinase inhibitor [Streptomyces bungoensis]|uniref:SSI family serine proteinase inhibitor n=1 Tax=Streptomyces bungoensis TaxID=285568 RepID=UPI003413D61B